MDAWRGLACLFVWVLGGTSETDKKCPTLLVCIIAKDGTLRQLKPTHQENEPS